MVLCYFWYLAVFTQSGTLLPMKYVLKLYFFGATECISGTSLLVFGSLDTQTIWLPRAIRPLIFLTPFHNLSVSHKMQLSSDIWGTWQRPRAHSPPGKYWSKIPILYQLFLFLRRQSWLYYLTSNCFLFPAHPFTCFQYSISKLLWSCWNNLFAGPPPSFAQILFLALFVNLFSQGTKSLINFSSGRPWEIIWNIFC